MNRLRSSSQVKMELAAALLMRGSSRLKSANAVQCVCSTPMAMRLTEPKGNGGA